GVPKVPLLIDLAAAEPNPRRVDHDDEVPPVHVGCKGRLVLPPDQLGHGARQPAEGHVGGIDQIPVVLEIGPRSGERLHESSDSSGFETGTQNKTDTKDSRSSQGGSRQVRRLIPARLEPAPSPPPGPASPGPPAPGPRTACGARFPSSWP